MPSHGQRTPGLLANVLGRAWEMLVAKVVVVNKVTVALKVVVALKVGIEGTMRDRRKRSLERCNPRSSQSTHNFEVSLAKKEILHQHKEQLEMHFGAPNGVRPAQVKGGEGRLHVQLLWPCR
mmetsp:Transcript_64551/g.107265  ORF Transcript_64551/g.107265 Transcript_64551/m.107265 type:complete len:122 (-) Transcript_64551:56-421(-)